MLRYVLIGAGFFSLGLGITGIFVPVLPTTPFLLLAAACFLRSSARLYAWLRRNGTLGHYIENYLRRRGITRRQKITSILVLWTMLALSAVFATERLALRLVLLAVGLGVTIHLLLIKTLED